MTYADECIDLEKWLEFRKQEIKKKYPQQHVLDGEANAEERKLMKIYKQKAKEIHQKYPNGPTEEDKKKIHEYFKGYM